MRGVEPLQAYHSADFKSAASTIPPHPRQVLFYVIISIIKNYLIKIKLVK